jgi:nicotinate-nucleotide adenylyltransferase
LFFFGGSFDPPHLGHEEIARRCKKLCDRFIFFPCKISPMKKHVPVAGESHRLQMTNLMAQNLGRKFVVDKFELLNDNPSYTINTISYLKVKYPKAELFMVLGADQMKNIENWKDSSKILKSVKIVCFNRGEVDKNVDFNFLDLECDISSSEIRENIKSQKKNLNLEVYKYIVNNNIYLNR